MEVGGRPHFHRLHAFGHGIHLDHGQVIYGIGADHGRRQAGVAAETDLDLLRALDHVVVGDDVPISVPEEPGAAALLRRGAPEEIGAQHLRRHIDHGRRDAQVERDPACLDIIAARKAAAGNGPGVGVATTITVCTRGVAVGVGVAAMNRPGTVQLAKMAINTINRSRARRKKRCFMGSVRCSGSQCEKKARERAQALFPWPPCPYRPAHCVRGRSPSVTGSLSSPLPGRSTVSVIVSPGDLKLSR